MPSPDPSSVTGGRGFNGAGPSTPPPPRSHARLDRAVFILSAATTAAMLPGVVPGRIMVEAWAYIVTGAALAAATRSPSWRGPLRDWCVAAFRIVSAVFGQRTVAAGRLLPLPVESWTQFLLGRTLVFMMFLFAACLRLAHAPRLAAATLAATAVILVTHQPLACRALVHGFMGSQLYFERVADVSRTVSRAVVAAVVGAPSAAAALPPLCAAHACAAAMSIMFMASLAAGGALDFCAAGAADGVAAAVGVAGWLVFAWCAIDAALSAAACPPTPLQPPASVVQSEVLVLSRVERFRLWPGLLLDGLRHAVGRDGGR